MRSEVHLFHSLFAAQNFMATIKSAQKSYRTLRIPRPKRGKPLYKVVVYDAA